MKSIVKEFKRPGKFGSTSNGKGSGSKKAVDKGEELLDSLSIQGKRSKTIGLSSDIGPWHNDFEMEGFRNDRSCNSESISKSWDYFDHRELYKLEEAYVSRALRI